MPPMLVRPPPWCRTFSDRYVSRATLTLGMRPHSFDPPHIKAHKAGLVLHMDENPVNRELRSNYQEQHQLGSSCAPGRQ